MPSSSLTPYERYYQTSGLAEYEEVFQYNNELDIEVATYLRLLRRHRAPQAPVLRILDIGCGLGTFTGKLLECWPPPGVQARPPPGRLRIDADLVDINSGAFDEYAQRVGSLPDLELHIGQAVCGAWQDIEAGPLGGPYDLVIANHCFYGTPIDASLIRQLTARAAPQGLVLLALASRHSDIYRMRQRAGVRINAAEDLEAALLQVNCNFSRGAYESDFHFDAGTLIFRNWLFATATASPEERDALLAGYSRQGPQRRFIVNRALVHVVEPEALPLAPE